MRGLFHAVSLASQPPFCSFVDSPHNDFVSSASQKLPTVVSYFRSFRPGVCQARQVSHDTTILCWFNPNSYLFVFQTTPVSHCSMSCSKTTVDPRQAHLSSALTGLLGDQSSATWASRRDTVPGHFPWEKCWRRGHFNPSFGYRPLSHESLLHFAAKPKRLTNVASNRRTSRGTLFSDKPLCLASMDWLTSFDSTQSAQETMVSSDFLLQNSRIMGISCTTAFELSRRSVFAPHEESEHSCGEKKAHNSRWKATRNI